MAAEEQNTTTHRPSGAVSQEVHDKAETFVNILQETLDLVENIIHYLSDEQYLEICNNLLKLKKINDENSGDRNATIRALQNRLNATEVVRTQRRYVNTTIRRQPAHLKDLEKLNKKDSRKRPVYERCNRCDTIVQRISMDRHKMTDKCERITRSKSVSADFKRKNTTDPLKIIDWLDNAIIKRREQMGEC